MEKENNAVSTAVLCESVPLKAFRYDRIIEGNVAYYCSVFRMPPCTGQERDDIRCISLKKKVIWVSILAPEVSVSRLYCPKQCSNPRKLKKDMLNGGRCEFLTSTCGCGGVEHSTLIVACFTH